LDSDNLTSGPHIMVIFMGFEAALLPQRMLLFGLSKHV